MNPRYSLCVRQQGITLVVSLIFLAVLAILAVTIARNSSMEERMSGNTRDRDLAFQSAEAALKDAEDDLPGLLGNAFDGSTAGLIAYAAANANDMAYWKAYNWAAASQEATAVLSQVNAKSRYVIEKKPNTGPVGTPTQHFRVTARGVGATPDAVVILQSEYDYN
ncbi:MAG: PilX N-terminal domain-containing pilus assembly protein [Thiobacillus sp.]